MQIRFLGILPLLFTSASCTVFSAKAACQAYFDATADCVNEAFDDNWDPGEVEECGTDYAQEVGASAFNCAVDIFDSTDCSVSSAPDEALAEASLVCF